MSGWLLQYSSRLLLLARSNPIAGRHRTQGCCACHFYDSNKREIENYTCFWVCWPMTGHSTKCFYAISLARVVPCDFKYDIVLRAYWNWELSFDVEPNSRTDGRFRPFGTPLKIDMWTRNRKSTRCSKGAGVGRQLPELSAIAVVVLEHAHKEK